MDPRLRAFNTYLSRRMLICDRPPVLRFCIPCNFKFIGISTIRCFRILAGDYSYIYRLNGIVYLRYTIISVFLKIIEQCSLFVIRDDKQQVLSVALFAIFIAMTVSIVVLVLWPLRAFGNHIRNNDSLPATGADELRRMADAYNLMYEENMKNHDILRKKAEHDHLTGLYNRSVFERLLELHANEHYALMLVDADHFKEVNDSLGHDVGDAILQKVARLLNNAFRTSDYPCRIGGDEFAVFMSDIDEELGYVVETKARRLLEGLLDTSDGLPALTLSIGIAFNDGTLSGEQVFKHADQALYKVKEAGRNGFRFYSD